MPSTPHDVWTFIAGATPGAVFQIAEQLVQSLKGTFRIAQETAMFRYRVGNDLTGYRDGSANPRGDGATQAATIADGPWRGGTFALTQRYLHFRGPFHALPREDRDRIVGRNLDTDEELVDAPATADIRRADQDAEGLPSFMLRRSMPWGGVGRHGLQFIAFMRDLAVADRIIDRMLGGADGHADALLAHTQAETGAYYFCPPLRGHQLVLGDSAVSPTEESPVSTNIVEAVEGNGARLLFQASRCIHSRNCVLSRPDVFVPNVQGEWLYPKLARPEEIAELAHRCPSGAIQYERTDGGTNEVPPLVNTVRVRENGPLAFHGELAIQDAATQFRATLCRCGRSQTKPFCDGSHAQGFQATGEPVIVESEVLQKRNGLLSITPMQDGPLMVSGSVEIVSGTGRTTNRASRANLCRCGASNNKPYCDGSHARVGFRG